VELGVEETDNIRTMTLPETLPTHAEIEEQLKRMTTSTRFQKAPNQAAFLELVVRRALAGQTKTREVTIGRLLFPGFLKDESTDVRVTASNLRKTLPRYYEEEGFDDLVLIGLPRSQHKGSKLPEGLAYTPEFSYNPTHNVSKEFKLGEYYRRRRLVEDCEHAMTHYAQVLKVAPYHIGACIGMAECLCGAVQTEYVIGYWNEAEKEEWIFQAARFLDRVHNRAKETWRLWATGAAMLIVLGKLNEAKDNFDVALSIDRTAVEQYPPYLYFLVLSGSATVARRLAARYLDRRVDDIEAHTTYADLLIETGEESDEKEAEKVLRVALKMAKNEHSVHYLLAKLMARQERADEYAKHLEHMRLLGDKVSHKLAKRCIKLPANGA
jgi:tetratricopeptide (TPR) repeat protein